jgi:hypothetical protein
MIDQAQMDAAIRREVERARINLTAQMDAQSDAITDLMDDALDASGATENESPFEEISAIEQTRSWAGYVRMGGARFYDSDIAADTATGTPITDNSTAAAKTWLVCNLSANTVTYEDGPPPEPLPHNSEWYEVFYLREPVHITRFG